MVHRDLPTMTMRTHGPEVDESSVTFRLPDPDRRLRGVRLRPELRIPAHLLAFRRAGSDWVLTTPRPGAQRMEYLLELHHVNGRVETVTDPGNPLRAGGAFGDKSVVEFPGYRPPAWLDADVPPGRRRSLAVPAPALRARVDVTLWSPHGLDDAEPALLLVVNDGPEYDGLAALTRCLAAVVAAGAVPAVRAALLAPGDRDRWYAANDAYADTLAGAVIPALRGAAPATARIGMGTSLGALAALHAQRRHPALFDGLFLQSGSFFHPRFDAHESGLAHYPGMVRYVAEVLDADGAPRAVPAVLVCGAVEENLDNNRLMTAALRDQGYDVELHEVPDAHNFTAWRDGFDPHLLRLLQRAVLV